MPNITIDLNQGAWSTLTSLGQTPNAGSKIDIVAISTQFVDARLFPRIPGAGKDQIVHVAADFDEPLDLDV